MQSSSRRDRLILALLACATAAVLATGLPLDARTPSVDATRAWFELAARLVAGAALLAWLPASTLGALRAREADAALLACGVVGSATAWPQALAWYALDLPEPRGAFGACVWLAPWACLASLRALARPAAMAPRHEPPREHASGATLGIEALLALVLLLPLARGADVADGVAVCWLALGVRVGVVYARRSRALAASAALVVALAAAHDPSSHAHGRSEFGAAGLAFGLLWLRRADARALVLSALAFGQCAGARWPDELYGWIGLAALVLATHAHARRRALIAVACGALLVAWPLRIAWIEKPGAPRHELDVHALVQRLLEPRGLAWLALPIAAAALALVLRDARRTRDWRVSPRELALCAALAAACAALGAFARARSTDAASALYVDWLAPLVLCAVLALAPPRDDADAGLNARATAPAEP